MIPFANTQSQDDPHGKNRSHSDHRGSCLGQRKIKNHQRKTDIGGGIFLPVPPGLNHPVHIWHIHTEYNIEIQCKCIGISKNPCIPASLIKRAEQERDHRHDPKAYLDCIFKALPQKIFPRVILPHKKDCRKNKCQNYTQSACLLGNDKIRHRKGQAHTEPGNTHRTPPVYTHQRTIKRKYSNHKHQKDTAGRIVKIAFFVKSVPDDTKQYQIHNKTKGDHSIFNFFT